MPAHRSAVWLPGWLVLAAACTPQAPTRADDPHQPPPATSRCTDVRALDLRRLLPPPPPDGSARARAELDELLRLQRERTPEQVRRAREDVRVGLLRFADALGAPAGLDPGRLPLTAALLKEVDVEDTTLIGPAKDAFARARPFTMEHALEPVVPRPDTASYPSGHATWAYTAALVLADLVPERRGALLARAEEYAHNRNVGGVHYPSDVQAGQVAGTVIAAMLFACPAFQSEEQAAGRELRAVLGLPAAAASAATP
jgi:acid phosphatase (class A)